MAQDLNRSHGPFTLNRVQQEGSQMIRNNIHSLINEMGPMMESARESASLNLMSWMRRHQSDRNCSQNSVPSTSESTIIDFGNSNDTHFPQANVFRSPASNPQEHHLRNNLSEVNLSEGRSSDNYASEHPDRNSSRNQTPSANSNNNNNNSNNNNNNGTRGNNSVTISIGLEVENSQTEASNLDMQYLAGVFQKYFPFVIILLAKAIHDHRAGILIFVGLLVTFTHADSVVKREIAKQSRRSLLSLFILFVNLFFCICFIYYVFQDQHLYKSLIFIPPYSQPLSLRDLLWIVGITDFVLKFITIQIKAGMACFPARLIPYSARGKWYLYLECISQLYRGLVPIQPWLYYLLESYQGPEKVIGVFLSAAYMVSKGSDLMSKIKLFKKAFWKLVQNVSLGESPSKEQLDTAGSQCPICHDEFETPILLHCRHVFCEACVTTWFDRKQTCPLCRTKVADDPTWKDGATTFFVQLF